MGSSGPETRIANAIHAELRRRGCWTLNIHGSQYMPAGTPDIIGCRPEDGRLFGMEVKKPGGVVSKLQARAVRKVREAGGIAGVVDSVDEAVGLLFG